MQRNKELAQLEDENGCTALHQAAHASSVSCVTLLLQHGANATHVDRAGATPYHIALASTSNEIIRLMESQPFDANRESNSNLLHFAAISCNAQTIQRLKQEMNIQDKPNTNGQLAIHVASFRGNNSIIDHLDGVNHKDHDGLTPLHLAAFAGHAHVAAALIRRGADVNALDNDGASPLHKAAFQGHIHVLLLLIERGAEFSPDSHSQSTPLHLSAINGHTECSRALILNGHSIDVKDSEGATPLHNAAWGGFPDVVELLLEAGASIQQDQRARTPLHFAAQFAFSTCVSILSANADALVSTHKHPRKRTNTQAHTNTHASTHKHIQTHM